MVELYAQTLKYFHLAIAEFLPTLRGLRDSAVEKAVKQELEDLIEAYEDIDAKIESHNLTYDDPNRNYDGEPHDIWIEIPEEMIKDLSKLSHRLLLEWKSKLKRLQEKKYLTDANKDEIHRLENLIWPLEALLKEDQFVLGKYGRTGPLSFPGEVSDQRLVSLLGDIQQCYSLGDQELLESDRLTETEERVRKEVTEIIEELGDEIFKLKSKKLNSGWRTVLKGGFHNRKTAESKLANWEKLIKEVLEKSNPNNLDTSEEVEKTIKRRLKTENLYVESRSRDKDLHLLIGKRDGTPDKAHVIVDGKTGEIRVEDNQQEPTDLVEKVESILTFPGGKRVRVTRESMEEIPSEILQRPRIDLVGNFTVHGSSGGNFVVFKVKNCGTEAAVDVKCHFVADNMKESLQNDIAPNLSPSELSHETSCRYTSTDLFKTKLENAKIIFSYKAPTGKSFVSGRKITQEVRADGNYNISSKVGDYFEDNT